MQDITKPISLIDISYPVFRMGTERPSKEGDVTLFIRHYGDDSISYKVVDDTSLHGDTIGKRRLQLLKDGVPVKKLGKAVFFLGDLIKMASPTVWLVDNNGLVFQYKKTTTALLTFKKIKYVHPISTGGAILEIEGIPSRFKTLFAPTDGERYAGILVLGISYILYGLYTQKYDDTRRKI